MRVELTGPDGELLARFSEKGAFKAERFGLGQPFRALVRAPFMELRPPPGDYTFQIVVDDVHVYSLEYPVIQVAELPPGWAARRRGAG